MAIERRDLSPLRHCSLTAQRGIAPRSRQAGVANVPFPIVLSDSPEFLMRSMHDGRMRTRVASAAIAALLAATVVGAAPSPARARVLATSQHAFSCSTEQLPPSKGQPVHVTANLDGVIATLRGTSGHAYIRTPRVLRPRLTVTSAEHVVTTFTPKPVPETPGRGVLLDGIDAPGAGTPALCLAQFPAGPVALIGTTNAFNQCCFLLDTYAPRVARRSVLQDGLVMPRLRLVNSATPVIVSADGSFLAQFSDYADSAAPLRVLTVRGDRQRDVTSSYRAKLRADAGAWWKRFDQRPQRGLGFLAAWAADQDRLGHDKSVWSTLHELDDAGKLSGMTGWPRNQAYITALKKFLTTRSYR
jgi:hypothetical protein